MQDLEMGSPWITWVALDPVTSVLRKGRQRQLDERGGSIKAETAVGVMWPQAKEHWPGAPGGWKRLQREKVLPAPRFWTSGPQNCERINFCCLWFVLICYDSLKKQIQSPKSLSDEILFQYRLGKELWTPCSGS